MNNAKPNPNHKTPIAVFVSGGGRTLKNLIDRAADGSLAAHITLVVGSTDCKALQIAEDHGIPTIIASPQWDSAEVEDLLTTAGAKFAVLAGYLKKLPIPGAFQGKVINIHPALLPKHGGKGMFGSHVHKAVLAARDTHSGCTVHIADDNYDRGPIIAQARCPVEPTDTPESLAARVFELELQLYPAALNHIFTNTPLEPRFHPDTLPANTARRAT